MRSAAAGICILAAACACSGGTAPAQAMAGTDDPSQATAPSHQTAPSQTTPAQTRTSGQAPIGESVHRLNKLEAEVKDLKSPSAGPPPAGQAARIAATVESPYLGFNFSYYGPANGSRFLCLRLVVVNPTADPLVVKANDLVLRVEG